MSDADEHVDDAADTGELPAITAPPDEAHFDRREDGRARGDSALVWVGGGAVIGIAALIAFGGGLGSGGPTSPPGSPSPTGAGTTPSTGRTVLSVPTAPVRPPVAPPSSATRSESTSATTADAGELLLEVGAQPGKAVYVEVRRTNARGRSIHAGTISPGTTKRFRARGGDPLWISVAWAPNVVLRLNGRRIAAPGGTEAYLVTTDGLERLTNTSR